MKFNEAILQISFKRWEISFSFFVIFVVLKLFKNFQIFISKWNFKDTILQIILKRRKITFFSFLKKEWKVMNRKVNRWRFQRYDGDVTDFDTERWMKLCRNVWWSKKVEKVIK